MSRIAYRLNRWPRLALIVIAPTVLVCLALRSSPRLTLTALILQHQWVDGPRIPRLIPICLRIRKCAL